MELSQVVLEHLRGIARGVTSDKHRDDLLLVLVNGVEHFRHFLELVGADIRAHGKAKVDQRELAKQILFSEWVAVLINQVKWATNKGLTITTVGLLKFLNLKSLLLAFEEIEQAAACRNKEESSLPVDKADSGLLFSLVGVKGFADSNAVQRLARLERVVAMSGSSRVSNASHDILFGLCVFRFASIVVVVVGGSGVKPVCKQPRSGGSHRPGRNVSG